MPDLDQFVVLLNEQREQIGRQRKSAVHHADTPLHLAFSLYLFDTDDRLLMTRRALGKVTWPGVWTNTCCGHPMPDESMNEAVDRRLGVELNLQVTNLQCVLPDFAYRTRDVSGIWENEVCPVFVGTLVHPKAGVRPNPREVMDIAWTQWDDLVAAMTRTPFAFSPWSVDQVAQMTLSAHPLTTRPVA